MDPRNPSKSVRRNIRDLAGIAHERELSAELHRLEESFARWRAGGIDTHGLCEVIHRFHDGPSRKLWKLYSDSDPSVGVAGAIAKGVLQPTEVPSETMKSLQGMVSFFAERSEEQSDGVQS